MNLLARIKAAFTPEKFFNSSMTILRGEPAKRSPFDYRSAVNAYRSWIYAAANLNAVAVALDMQFEDPALLDQCGTAFAYAVFVQPLSQA